MIKTLSSHKCNLGEGINISADGQSIAWVDIHKKNIFYLSKKNETQLKIESTPSKVLCCEYDMITYLSHNGIFKHNFKNGKTNKIYDLKLKSKFYRTNDAVYYNNDILFGTMHIHDNSLLGEVYILRNNELKSLDKMHIPNSFIVTNNKILISDSYKKIVYEYDFKFQNRYVWKDFSELDMIPDGGCFSPQGTIFICFWGSGKIIEFDTKGKMINMICTPCKNPTSCAIYKNKLIFTSAKTDTYHLNNNYNGKTFYTSI